jgi:acetyl-CoA decarbonylase/synthase, CODH/ACS complex subunit beta
VMRGYRDVTVNGLPFSTMADSTAGGRQVEGFHGISLEYMRSSKFLAADGGYTRIVWMPAELKEQLREFIPEDLAPKIASENDVKTVEELQTFLAGHSHPVVSRWVHLTEVSDDETGEGTIVYTAAELPFVSGGVRIILKNARIYADKVTIIPVKPGKPGKEV